MDWMDFLSEQGPATALNIGANALGDYIKARAAGGAAGILAPSHTQAAQAQEDGLQNALNYIQNARNAQIGGLQPYTNAGAQSSATLASMLAPGGQLSQTFNTPFTPPTADSVMNSPEWQSRMKLGQQAIERAASARGSLNSGATGKALTRYGQDIGSQANTDIYNKAFNDWQAQQNQFNTNQNALYGRYSGQAAQGQGAAATAAGVEGTAGSNLGNISGQIGQARGTGILGSAGAQAQGVGTRGAIYGGGAATLGNYVGRLPQLIEGLRYDQSLRNGAATGSSPAQSSQPIVANPNGPLSMEELQNMYRRPEQDVDYGPANY